METMKSRTGTMETQLKQWGAKLDALVAKAEHTGVEAKADYQKRIDEVKAKLKVAHSKLDELKAAGDEGWETFQAGVEGTWKDIEAAFKKLAK